MIIVCPNCQDRVSVADNNTDFIHQCNQEGDNRANERQDILRMGKWSDYTGSGGRVFNPYAGIGNKLQGTRSELEGGKSWDRTKRGNRTDLYRTRDYEQYFEVDKE